MSHLIPRSNKSQKKKSVQVSEGACTECEAVLCGIVGSHLTLRSGGAQVGACLDLSGRINWLLRAFTPPHGFPEQLSLQLMV